MRKKTIIRHVKDGKRVPAGTPGAAKIKARSRKWYADIDGKPVPLSSNKTVAQQMLGELLRKAELRRTGLASPATDYARVPLATMLDEFRAHIAAGRGPTAKPPSAAQCSRVLRRVSFVLDGCGFTFASDISLAQTQAFLASLSAGVNVEVLDKPAFTPAELDAGHVATKTIPISPESGEERKSGFTGNPGLTDSGTPGTVPLSD